MSDAKTALITGGTDGIGKATAHKLLEQGWEVVIVGRNAARCESTFAELKAVGQSNSISAIVADLSIMRDVQKAAESFLESHKSLDFLFLNANAIAQTRIITSEGFESNLALGYLGRVLLTLKLNTVLKATPGAQILTVVGLNVARLDFDDLTMEKQYTSQAALGRWQWAMQVFTGEYNRRNPVPMNIYIPGLVRTKILSNEPQPMRTMVKVMNLIIGIPVEKAASNVVSVLGQIARSGNKNVTYAWKKQREPLDLKLQPEDADRLWKLTNDLLHPYGV